MAEKAKIAETVKLIKMARTATLSKRPKLAKKNQIC